MRDESITPPRRVAVIAFDVTGLTDDEIGHLTGEAIVQGESSEADPEFGVSGHPNAPFVGEAVIDTDALEARLDALAEGDSNDEEIDTLRDIISGFPLWQQAEAGTDHGTRDRDCADAILALEGQVGALRDVVLSYKADALHSEAFGHAGLYEAVAAQLTGAEKDLRRAWAEMANGDPEDHSDYREED